MTEHILSGDPPVPLLLRRSARARRISLRVSALDGRVTLTLPKRVAQQEALDFAESKSTWIRRQLAQYVPPSTVGAGSSVMIQGKETRIELGKLRKATLKGDTLWLPGSPEMAPARLKAYLKLRAKAELLACTSYYAAKVQRPVNRITLRDTRSRWGSCTSAGNLMFSWRLIMAPPEVLDYVAAHEVAHLVEMNHSDAYWAVVDDICPGYQAHRLWLRQNGARLHRYRFAE